MTPQTDPNGVKGYECKHALYFTANDGSPNDVVVVKEYKHYNDGRVEPNLRFLVNYKRPFWVTREAYRKHKDKKEWEKIERLQKFESTQILLPQAVGRALGRAPAKDGMRSFSSSPYLYGCDADTPLLVKRQYMDKWPDCISDNRVAVLDTETDMVEGHEEPIMGSLTMGEKVKIVIVNSFMAGVVNPEQAIRDAAEKYLNDPTSKIGALLTQRNIKIEIEWAKNAGEAMAKLITTAHEWQPDILAIWNINFDVPKINWVLEKYRYDLADVWCDPRVPPHFRHFRYIEGKAQKKTASGKVMSLHWAEQWHVVDCPASFYVLDAACVYLKLRIAKGKESSYSLDYILKKHKVSGKLKFEAADHVKGGAWHRFMQEFFKPEYCVYNIYDCIGLELLDETTTDLRRVASLMCGHSPWARFPSQPKRTVDDLYFFCLERGQVTATCSRDMVNEHDKLVIGLENWIVTLPSYLVHDDGIKALEELPDVTTNFRAHVADLDVEGTYPNEEILMNISKETTAQELAKVQGMSEATRRAVGINLSGGHVNAVEIVVKSYGAPTMDQLLAAFQTKIADESALPENVARALPAITTAVKPTGFNSTDTAFADEDVVMEKVDEDSEEDEFEEAD